MLLDPKIKHKNWNFVELITLGRVTVAGRKFCEVQILQNLRALLSQMTYIKRFCVKLTFTNC